MGPLAFTVGLRLSVDASSWILPISSVHSHWVRTRFRSTPCGRGGAGGVSPVAMRSLQSANIASPALAPEARHPHAHLGPALPHPHPRVPGVGGRVVLLRIRMPARELAPDLVAAQAGLHVVEVLVAGPEPLADAVAVGAGARKLVRLRHVDQRQPVGWPDRPAAASRGVCATAAVNSRSCTRRGRDRRRVHQPVAPHPDRVARLRELRQQESAVVAGDHDLAELRRQVAGLGDDPDARLRDRRRW